MALPRLHSLWVGNRLKYLERLCLVSAMDVGHDFTLWSYEPDKLENLPEGVELRDASEIMPRERLITYSDTDSIALGANFWRYELLAKGHGYWVDMDFLFVRPLDFEASHVYTWEHEGRINNAVLRAPPDSPFVKDLLTLPQPNRRPPWFGPKKSLQYYWQRLTRGDMGLEDYPWGTFSAGLVTYAAKRNNLAHYALDPMYLHPISWADARKLYGPAEELEAMLSEETRAIHMWHSRLVGLYDKPPPEGSYIYQACKKHNIDTSD